MQGNPGTFQQPAVSSGERRSFARRQPGRMLEKICLCFTCPAMTARVTPSRRKVSMSLESSPSESQCTVAPRDSISRFLFDRGDHNFVALRAGSIEDEEWEASVACDDAEFGV